MSITTSVDSAIDRLNYFNGQRLAASDFRTEQGYHLGMRRLLNRALFSAGIASGLEVTADPSNARRVIVGHGVAFDNQGREIFVPADVAVPVIGTPSSSKGVVFDNLLAVSYSEARQNLGMSGCVPSSGMTACGDLAWGAPTRIVAEAVFEFLDSWPAADSGKVVLAQIQVSPTCEVAGVLTGIRQYAVPPKAQSVQPLTLGGEKNIDSTNRKDLYFHVVGGFPGAVTLYLRGGTFSTLYYTELGSHRHALGNADPNLSLGTKDIERDFTHDHHGTAGTTDTQPNHTHNFIVDNGETQGGINVNDSAGDFIQGNNPMLPTGDHTHSLVGLTLSTELFDWSHHHAIESKTELGGATDIPARAGKPRLTTFKDITLFLDDQPITEQVCDQLEARPGQAGQWRLEPMPGDVRMNGVTLSLAAGTGAIDLLKLGIEIGLGQHVLSFRVNDADAGGNLQYDVYVA